MTFTNNNYYQEKFSDLKLEKEKVFEIEFENCEFINSSFLETQFSNCKFIDCHFLNCLLSAPNLTNSSLVNTTFTNTKAIGIDWTKALRIETVNFFDSQINYSNFRQVDLTFSKFENCEAFEVDFTESNLTNSSLVGTDFKQAVFNKTNLSRANFQSATNYYIDIKNNTLKKAQFSLPEAINLLSSLDITLATP